MQTNEIMKETKAAKIVTQRRTKESTKEICRKGGKETKDRGKVKLFLWNYLHLENSYVESLKVQ